MLNVRTLLHLKIFKILHTYETGNIFKCSECNKNQHAGILPHPGKQKQTNKHQKDSLFTASGS